MFKVLNTFVVGINFQNRSCYAGLFWPKEVILVSEVTESSRKLVLNSYGILNFLTLIPLNLKVHLKLKSTGNYKCANHGAS